MLEATLPFRNRCVKITGNVNFEALLKAIENITLTLQPDTTWVCTILHLIPVKEKTETVEMITMSKDAQVPLATNSVLLLDEEELKTLVSQTIKYTDGAKGGSPYFIPSSLTEDLR